MVIKQERFSNENPRYKIFVLLIGLIGGLAGLMFGLDQGVIGGALPFIAKTFHANDVVSELIVSSMLWGCVIGVIICAFIIKYLGRKRTLQISACLFGCFSLLCALSVTANWLIVSRFCLGIGVGMATFSAPIYLSEIAPPQIRGRLISFYQLAICFGILLAQLIDFYFSNTENWRMMLGILVLPAIAMLIGFLILPYSPRWLYLVDRKEEAEEVLKKVRKYPEEEVAFELAEIETALNIKKSIWTLLKNKNYLKVLYLGVILQTMQQWTGFNACIYYGPTIFRMAGFTSNTGEQLGTASTGLVFLLGTVIAILFVDNFGRRKLLIAGFAGMAVSFFIIAFIFNFGKLGDSVESYIVLACIWGFVFGFGISAAPVVWILCAEIYPLQGRDLGMAVSTATNWIMCGIVGATFLSIKNTFGTGNTFLLYGILCFLFVFITLILVPETKGITLEEIEENLMAGKKLRKIGV